MPKLPILNVLSLLAIAFIISGCFWSGPWPRIDINTEGLGEGELAKFLRRNTNYGEDGLKQLTKQFIVEQTSAKGISRDDAEALGLRCAQRPARSAAIRANTGFETISDTFRAMVPTTEHDQFITSTYSSRI